MVFMFKDAQADKALTSELRSHIENKTFPCVGAKSALARGLLEMVVCHRLSSAWDDIRIHDELLRWSKDYAEQPEGFRSLAFIFRDSPKMSENNFEKHMWDRLQSLADKDEWRGQEYDNAVSPDPDDPHFGLSFGGQGYFVVGMHPNASRPARRFRKPVLVFNLHDQFEQLRAEGRYERIRETILERDESLAGDINPMLARHGEASEAAQYSGRKVGEDWQCPFRDKLS